MRDNIVKFKTDKSEFDVYCVKPSESVKGGLILIHEVWGLDGHVKDVAQRFAKQGYYVLAPDLLSQTGITEMAGELKEALFDPEKRSQAQPQIRKLMAPMQAPEFAVETIAKVQSCFEYLSNSKDAKNRVAVTGFCFGGTYSFSLAIAEPTLRAAAPFYGHCEASAEELRKIKCPIMAFYGENDERLIGGLDKLKKDMKDADVNFTAKVYPNSGHAFFNDTNVYTYNKDASDDSWKTVLEFLESSMND